MNRELREALHAFTAPPPLGYRSFPLIGFLHRDLRVGTLLPSGGGRKHGMRLPRAHPLREAVFVTERPNRKAPFRA